MGTLSSLIVPIKEILIGEKDNRGEFNTVYFNQVTFLIALTRQFLPTVQLEFIRRMCAVRIRSIQEITGKI